MLRARFFDSLANSCSCCFFRHLFLYMTTTEKKNICMYMYTINMYNIILIYIINMYNKCINPKMLYVQLCSIMY